MAKRKKYADIDAVPQAEWDSVTDLVRQGRHADADTALKAILVQIQDLKQFEAFMIVRKLKMVATVDASKE